MTLHNIRTRLRHWWQRNFGYVYLKDMNVLGDGRQYLFRARHGRVALVWRIITGDYIEFICRLAKNGEVQNAHDSSMRGYGKQYGGWVWQYEPFQPGRAIKGGAW